MLVAKKHKFQNQVLCPMLESPIDRIKSNPISKNEWVAVVTSTTPTSTWSSNLDWTNFYME